MGPALFSIAGRPTRAAGLTEAPRVPRDELGCKADLCTGALTEARRQISEQRFGPILGQVLARACDLLDEMDEFLVGLHPGRDHEAFVRVAALHRHLEEIQSLVPRKFRWLARWDNDNPLDR